MLMFILKDEQIKPVIDKIKEVIGDIDESGTAVLFTIPIDYAEGLGE